MDWYDPGQIITRNGSLVIMKDSTVTQQAGLTPGESTIFCAFLRTFIVSALHSFVFVFLVRSSCCEGRARG